MIGTDFFGFMDKDFGWGKNVALFLGGQGVSLLGSALVQYAIMWEIMLETRSGTAMTLFVVLGVLPTFFLSPFGGVWADRFNRKHLINIADGSIALVSVIVVVAFALNHRALWLLFAGAAVRALGQGVQTPAVNAFIPQITPREHLLRINGINNSIFSFVMIVAPMGSAALLTHVSLEVVFLIDVVTAAVGISIVYFGVKIPRVSLRDGGNAPALPKGRTNYFHDFREGVRYVKRTRFIGELVGISILFNIVVSPAAFLTPLQVTRNFGEEFWRLSTMEIAFSAGMLAGGLLVGFWGGFKNKVYSMAAACVLMGAGSAMLGVLGNFWHYLGVMLFIGVVLPFFNTPSVALLQSNVDEAYMGRVLGVFSMVGSLMLPSGMLLFGPLSDSVGIDLLMVLCGGVMVLLAIPFVASKTMREAGRA